MLKSGGSGSAAGAAPDQQGTGPVLERDAHADAALDGLGLDLAAGAGERLPQLGRAGHAGDDDLHRVSAGARIEPVAHAAVPAVQLVCGVGGQVDLGGARVDGGDEQHGALAVAAQERRHRSADDARHVRERLVDLLRRRDAARGARGEACGQRGDGGVVAGGARRERADRDQGATGVDELGQALRGRGLEHLAPGQDDRAVRLVRGLQLRAGDGRARDRVVVEHVEVAREAVERARPHVEPLHVADEVDVERVRAPARLPHPVEPQRRARGRGREQHADVAGVVPPREHRAQARDRPREVLVVAPVRLPPVGRRAAPTPTSPRGWSSTSACGL